MTCGRTLTFLIRLHIYEEINGWHCNSSTHAKKNQYGSSPQGCSGGHMGHWSSKTEREKNKVVLRKQRPDKVCIAHFRQAWCWLTGSEHLEEGRKERPFWLLRATILAPERGKASGLCFFVCCLFSFFKGHYYQSGVKLHWLKCPDVKKGHEVLRKLALYKVIGEDKREQGEARTGEHSFWSHFTVRCSRGLPRTHNQFFTQP